MRLFLRERTATLMLTTAVLWAGASHRAAAAETHPSAISDSSDSQAALLRELNVSSGLVVHLGCGDGALTTELATSERLVVQGWDKDPNLVAKARERLFARNVYGRVSVDRGSFAKLPYANNLADLVIADDLPHLLADGLPAAEILRVTAPGGVAAFGVSNGGLSEEDLRARMAALGVKDFKITRTSGLWAFVRKARPAEMDEWTHRCHGPDGCAVSHDSLFQPPDGLRWQGGPRFPTGALGGALNGIVSAGGRNFYLATKECVLPPARNAEPAIPVFLTMAQMSEPAPRCLIARDAWNGLPLWVRDYAVEDMRLFGPRSQTSLLVATAEHVFTVMKGRVAALDAATGEVAREYCEAPDPAFAKLLYRDNRLVVAGAKSIRTFDAASGQEIWSMHPDACSQVILGGSHMFLCDGPKDLIALDLEKGVQAWRLDTSAWGDGPVARLFYKEDSLVAVTQKMPTSTIRGLESFPALGRLPMTVHVLAAGDGKLRWRQPPIAPSTGSHLNVLYADGLVWIEESAPHAPRLLSWSGLDPISGEIKRHFDSHFGGDTCNPVDMATERCFIFPRPVAYMSWKDGSSAGGSSCARTGCTIGSMIANGLLYTNPEHCTCVKGDIRGFDAFAPKSADEPQPEPTESPNRYESHASQPPKPFAMSAADWPTFRHDARRGGSAATALADGLAPVWDTRLDAEKPAPALLVSEWNGRTSEGDRLTAPVVAGGLVFVGLCEAHTVVACDAATGKQVWRFTAGGRLDAPPTIFDGMCLIGCYDGWVYGLSAADGALIWRYRAAPADKRIVAYGGVESVWPVVGGVLVQDGVACVAAGRSAPIDGGIYLNALDPRTGKLLWTVHPQTPEAMADLLVSDGAHVALSTLQEVFDPKTGKAGRRTIELLRAVTGGEIRPGAPSAAWRPDLQSKTDGLLLDHSWHWNETAGFTAPILDARFYSQAYDGLTGQIVIFNDNAVIAYRRKAMKREASLVAQAASAKEPFWTLTVAEPFQVHALALAGETLLAAGPVDYQAPEKGGALWVVSAKTGKKLNEIPLPATPAADGIAIADGRVYVSLRDGRLLAFKDARLPEQLAQATPQTAGPEPAKEAGKKPEEKSSGGPGPKGNAEKPPEHKSADSGKHSEAVQQLIRKLDKDGDGKLSFDELAAGAPAESRDAIKERMKPFDKDGDGKLDADELEAALSAMGR